MLNYAFLRLQKENGRVIIFVYIYILKGTAYMMNFKKKLSAAAALTLSVVMLAGCGNTGSSETSETQQTTAATTAEPASRIAELTGGKATIPELSLDQYEIPENDALSFTKDRLESWQHP